MQTKTWRKIPETVVEHSLHLLENEWLWRRDEEDQTGMFNDIFQREVTSRLVLHNFKARLRAHH